MNTDNLNWVDKNSGKWEYEITKPLRFTELTGGTFGCFKAYGKNDSKLLIEGRGLHLYIHPGYRFDGCTAVGKIYETPDTLMAACLHDVLYQVGKQQGYTAAWSLTHADKLFLWYMRRLGVNCIIRNLWYAGVRTFGAAFKCSTLDTLNITPANHE